MTMTPKEAQVWQTLLNHRKSPPSDIAERCGVEVEFVENLIARIGSPNWRDDPWPHAEGRKDDQEKPRLDLVPPELVEGVGHVLTFGANKYGERNWERGMAWGRPYAALMRHMLAWWGGENVDPETGMSHLWHAACCLAMLMAYEQRGAGYDDRPNHERTTDAGMAQEEGAHHKVA